MSREHFDPKPRLLRSPSGSEPQLIDLGHGRCLELRELVGKGSFASVYRAVLCDGHGICRPVALKLFSTLASDEGEQVQALLFASARRIAYVDHPNVARLYECGVWQGRPFLVTELVDGVALSAFQQLFAAQQRRMPLDLALYIATEVGDALAGARVARDHGGVQLGIVHHAISAREVLLSWRGEVKLTDFETSQVNAVTSSIRSMRGVAARIAALSPEVAQGAPGDARADVFSFGILLRELFIAPRFHPAVSNADAVRLAREGFVQPVTFQPRLPAGLVAIMERALAIDPELRYPNACVMAVDLRREAFAMGVSDGRWFLHSALARVWSERAEEITAERAYPVLDPEPQDVPKRRR